MVVKYGWGKEAFQSTMITYQYFSELMPQVVTLTKISTSFPSRQKLEEA